MSAPLRLVVFDVDGTLVDSQADIVGGMRTAFGMLGLPAPDRSDILASVGLSLPETMAHLAPLADAATQAELVGAYKRSYFELRQNSGSKASSPLFPHVRAVMEDLNAHPETLLGVATGKSRRGLNMLVEAHDLRPLLVTQQCADDHPSKPHPSMLEAALAETGVNPEDAVMVGDSSFDMEMAQAAGVTPIGVSWGYQPSERLKAAAAVIDDIRDLPTHLDRIWSVSA